MSADTIYHVNMTFFQVTSVSLECGILEMPEM